MHWSAQYPGLGFTQPDLLPWLPSSSAWSNVAAGHQTIIQAIAKLREEAPSIYMDGIYKDNEKLPNYAIRYARILQNSYKFGTQQMLDSSQDNITYYTTIQATPTAESKSVSMAHGYMQFTAFLKGSADLTFVLS